MDGGLDRIGEALEVLGQPIAAEVGRLLRHCADPAAADASIELNELEGNHATYRVQASTHGRQGSLILKQVDPDVARRNRLVVERWLPWLGLDHVAPALLGAAGSPGAESIWQVHEDLRGTTLHEHRSEPDCVAAAVELIAELHTRAGGHPVVAECRRQGQDLGMHYVTSNMSDAARLLDALGPPQVQPSRAQAELRDRLRRRLALLLGAAPGHGRLLEEAGGLDTMLHGDPWPTNIVVLDTRGGLSLRLGDWDRAGAGPFCYDLSLLLYRFPARDRPWIVERYRDAVAPAGWRLAPASELNVLFRTFECARYANRIVWPAIALLREDADWGWDELARIEEWFEALDPALPE
jgi:hypothetical protein